MVTHSKMKLGKQTPRHDLRTLQLANYLAPSALPKAPANVDWAAKVARWPMMANDKIGDLIEIGRLAVEYDEPRAVLLGQHRESGRGPHHERGPDGKEQVALRRVLFCPAHRLHFHNETACRQI